jgi:propionate catabolism operon transcriptional regulator
MQAVRHSINLFARSPATVLIQGETGTGKELVAQAIHRESPRVRQPFVAINCGAVAESLLESELFGYEEGAFTGSRRGGHAGLFEAANRGTLFLDEIGEMPLPLQTRLLRVLEEREVVRVGGTRPIPVDVRIISATHCDLDARIHEGRFRADLFYRLGVLRVALPPLRERTDDLVALAEWCLKNALAALNVRPHANLHAEVVACAPLLASYAWPGNVRELRNLMERLALFLAAQPLQALTPSFVLGVAPELAKNTAGIASKAPTDALPSSHQENIADVLARFGGNREAAARHLGISRTTLWRKLRELN